MSKLQKIKEILFGAEEAVVETVDAKFVDVISGNMVIRVDGELAVDATVAQVTIDADGNEIVEALADGEYLLEDGQTIVVMNSIITEIKPAEVESPESESEVEITVEAETEVVEAEVAPESVTTPEMLLEALNALDARIAVLEAANTQMSTQLQEFAKAPGAPAVKVEKAGLNKFNKQEIEDKLIGLSKLR